MNDIADTTKTKFARHNSRTVLDMNMFTATEVSEIMNDKEFRVPEQKLRKWQDKEKQANKGGIPSRVQKYHMKDTTPYLSRHGSTWKDEIRKCATM
jgi:hypothetical protein